MFNYGCDLKKNHHCKSRPCSRQVEQYEIGWQSVYQFSVIIRCLSFFVKNWISQGLFFNLIFNIKTHVRFTFELPHWNVPIFFSSWAFQPEVSHFKFVEIFKPKLFLAETSKTQIFKLRLSSRGVQTENIQENFKWIELVFLAKIFTPKYLNWNAKSRRSSLPFQVESLKIEKSSQAFYAKTFWRNLWS